jgi:hypothetical protein
MDSYEFAFVVEGFDVEDSVTLDHLYETFDDVSAAWEDGKTTLMFVVEAEKPEMALKTAYLKLTTGFPLLRVLRVDRDLVTASEIAARVNRTPESVRQLATGQRGPGDFPAPFSVLSGGTRVWAWSDVVSWFEASGRHVENNLLIDHETATRFDMYIISNQAGFKVGEVDMLQGVAGPDGWGSTLASVTFLIPRFEQSADARAASYPRIAETAANGNG